MDTLSTHYAHLLGIDTSWKVEDVNLQVDQRRVEIRLAQLPCHEIPRRTKSDDPVKKDSAEIHAMNGWGVGYLDSTDSYVGMLMDTDFPYRLWAPYREHLTDRLFNQGVDSIFTDELERRGTMFQIRALKETYDAMSRAYPGRRAVVLSRGGFSGCQRYAYWWMGDTGAHVGSARSTLRAQRAQLGHGLAGLPHTTHDLGGYFGPASVRQGWSHHSDGPGAAARE